MSIPPLSRDAALRIALAARILPGIEVGQLLEILQRRIDGDINEESLKTITVTQLKTGFGSADGEEDGEDISLGLPAIKEAVRILWGETVDEPLPTPAPDNGLQPGAIRVAIASNGGETLNGHFGSCIRFLVYQVSATDAQLIGIRSALEADFSDDRNLFRTNLIKDCHLLYVVSIGGPAAAKVGRAGIYPMKIVEGGEAGVLLEKLQAMMRGNPPPWLAKVMGIAAEERVRFERTVEEQVGS